VDSRDNPRIKSGDGHDTAPLKAHRCVLSADDCAVVPGGAKPLARAHEFARENRGSSIARVIEKEGIMTNELITPAPAGSPSAPEARIGDRSPRVRARNAEWLAAALAMIAGLVDA
jgi:hypothetical protein